MRCCNHSPTPLAVAHCRYFKHALSTAVHSTHLLLLLLLLLLLMRCRCRRHAAWRFRHRLLSRRRRQQRRGGPGSRRPSTVTAAAAPTSLHDQGKARGREGHTRRCQSSPTAHHASG